MLVPQKEFTMSETPIFDQLVSEFFEGRNLRMELALKDPNKSPETLYKVFCEIFGFNHQHVRSVPEAAGQGLKKDAMKGQTPTLEILDEAVDYMIEVIDEPQVITKVEALTDEVFPQKQDSEEAFEYFRVGTLRDGHIARLSNVDTQELDVSGLREMMMQTQE